MLSLPSVLIPFQTLCGRSPLEIALTGVYPHEDGSFARVKIQTNELFGEMTDCHAAGMTWDQLHEAMRCVDRLLSLGILFIALQKQLTPSSYCEILRDCRVPGLVSATSMLFEIVTTLPSRGTITEVIGDEASDREHLVRRCLRAHDTISAMSFLIVTRRQRLRWRDQIALVKWLFAHTRSGKQIGRQPELYFGAGSIEAEDAITLIIPHEIGLLDRLPEFGSAAVCKSDVTASEDLSRFRLLNKSFREAAGRFHALRAQLPDDLKKALPVEWLERLKVIDFTPPSTTSDASDIRTVRR